MDEQTFNQQFTGKSGQERFNALSQSLDTGAGQSAAVEQTASAEPAPVDSRAYEYLQRLYKDTAPADRSTQFLQTWERDVASVLAGRKWGESVADFAARTQSAAPAVPAAEGEQWMPAAQMTDADRGGYVIPPEYAGFDFDKSALAWAKANGISQAQFNSYCRMIGG